MKLKAEVREARARLDRLQKQLDFLEDKEEEMVRAEWRNIHELEDEERSANPELSFDVSSELFQLPSDLNWPSLSSDRGSVATPTGSAPSSQ